MQRVILSDIYQERAAILEFHGGFIRVEAERLAREQVFHPKRRPPELGVPLGWSYSKIVRFMNRRRK